MKLNLPKALSYQGGIRGLKLILGAALIVLAKQIEALEQLVPMFPDLNLQGIMILLQSAIDWLSWLIGIAGQGFLWVGFLDKIRKLLS